MSYDLVPMPDGVTPDLLENLTLAELLDRDPERAAILIDHAVKYHLGVTRKKWNDVAQLLLVSYEEGNWRYHPAGFSTFFEWLQQSEIDISPSTASDMMAVARLAPTVLEETGIDLYDLVLEVGPSKVRLMVARIRDCIAAGSLAEQLPEMVDAVRDNSFRKIKDMFIPEGSRTKLDYEAVYVENADGTANVTLRNLDFDMLEKLAEKIRLRRWFDQTGHRIDPPINALPQAAD